MQRPRLFILLYLLGIVALWRTSHCEKLASFNIQVFGDRKMANENVVAVLIKILKRYDIVAIQEIRDSNGDSFEELVARLNKEFTTKQYESIVGERLGKSNSKEQYGLIYKKSMFDINDARTVPGYEKRFERPPLRVHVLPKNKALPGFELLVVHLDPDDVVNEMQALYEISQGIVKEGIQNILIAGDMNADCSYLSNKNKKILHFSTDQSYTWFINDEADTTVGNTNCAYDRFIVHGAQLKSALLADTARPFPFPKEFNLEDELAKKVSDHYPIEIDMGTSRPTGSKPTRSTKKPTRVTDPNPTGGETSTARPPRRRTTKSPKRSSTSRRRQN